MRGVDLNSYGEILANIAVFKTRWQGLVAAQPDINAARSALLSLVNSEEQGIILYRLGGLAAIEGKIEQALNYLQEAMLLEDEAIEFARHDVAWLELRNSPNFLMLIAEADRAVVDSKSSNKIAAVFAKELILQKLQVFC